MNQIKLAFKGLFARPTGLIASCLTVAMAGIVVILSLGLWSGFDQALKNDINKMGADILAIPKGCPYEATGAILSGSAIGYSIETELMEEVREVEGVSFVSGLIMGQRGAGKDNKVMVFFGVDDNFFKLKPHLGENLNINPGEMILGYHAAMMLDVELNDIMQLGTKNFKITHILSEFGNDDDTFVGIDIVDAWEILDAHDRLSSILMKLDNPDSAELVADKLMDIANLQVITINDFYETVSGFAIGAKMAINSVTIVILLIAIIGIVLVQVSSIVRRRGEIGMMRSVGATTGQMFSQSLISSGILGFIGGTIGILIGYFVSPVIENLIRLTLPQAPNGQIVAISIFSMLVTLTITIIISVMAGIIPAMITAQVNPVEAIGE